MTPRLTVADLARLTGATLHGDGATPVEGASPLDAIRPGTVVFAEKERDVPSALASQAAVVIASAVPAGIGTIGRPALLVTPHVRRVFAEACQALFAGYPAEASGIHPTAVVDPSARLGSDVAIGPHVAVSAGCRVGARTTLRAGVVLDEGAVVGDDCYLFPGVVIGRYCEIGHRTILHPNAVVGGEGFGFAADETANVKQPQFGRVIIGNDCEIGAGTTLDRGTLGDTVVGDDVKLDNLVQVAHNCRIGNHVRLSALTGLSGGVVIEDNCVFGGQVGVQNRVTIGKGTMVGGQAGITGDVPAGSVLWGTPAHPLADARREAVAIRRLPDLLKRVRALEDEVKALKDRG